MFSLILEFFCSPKSYLFLCLKKMQTSKKSYKVFCWLRSYKGSISRVKLQVVLFILDVLVHIAF